MQEIVIPSELSGNKIVRALSKLFPQVPPYVFQKALKNKDIVVNGTRVKMDLNLQGGEVVRLYLTDEQLQARPSVHAQAPIESIFESKNILIVNKPQGLTVHPGSSTPEGSTLIEQLREATRNPQLTLFHRLDRNTGGLVLLAKNKVTLGKLNEVLAKDQMVKRYRCLVKGIPDIGSPVLLSDGDQMLETKAYWERPKGSDSVYVHAEPREHDLPMVTRYRVLQVFTQAGEKGDTVSELEVELVTGRTHQIRAHMAFLGHPILGDGKYGRNEFNLQFRQNNGKKLPYQQLFASSLLFSGDLPAGLEELRRKTFSITPNYLVSGVKAKRL